MNDPAWLFTHAKRRLETLRGLGHQKSCQCHECPMVLAQMRKLADGNCEATDEETTCNCVACKAVDFIIKECV